jgi:hypothetical protein
MCRTEHSHPGRKGGIKERKCKKEVVTVRRMEETERMKKQMNEDTNKEEKIERKK